MKKNEVLLGVLLLAPAVLFFPAGVVKADIDGEELSVDPRSYWRYANALYAQRTGDSDRAAAEYEKASNYDPKSAAIHERLASLYYMEGLDYKSVEELQKARELQPNNIEIRLMLAQLFTTQGEYNKGQKEYQDILHLDPKNFEARHYLAGVFAAQNRTEDALDQYGKILEDNPAGPAAAGVYYDMGMIYTRANQAAKAEEAFKKAIDLDPELEAAYSSLGMIYELDQKPQEAVDTYEALLKVSPENAQIYLSLGQLYYNQKEDSKALEAFQNYAQRKPDDPAAEDYIGLCYFRMGQFPKAVESFQKLLDKQPANVLIRYRLAAAYDEMKDFDNEKGQLEAILNPASGAATQQPGENGPTVGTGRKEVDAWVRLALLYDKQKDLAGAEKAIEDALKAVPDHPELLLVQAMLYQEKEEGLKAAPLYQKVIEMEQAYKRKQAPEYNVGTLGQAYFNLGALMDKQGKFNEAIDDMKKVVDIEPDNPDAYNYIGYSYADRGIQLDDALKFVQDAVKLDPNNSYYLDSLGWVYYRKALYPQAQEQLEKAVQFLKTRQKDDAVIYDHLAQVLMKMGRKDDAVAQWKKALELDPANKDYAEKIQKNSSPDL